MRSSDLPPDPGECLWQVIEKTPKGKTRGRPAFGWPKRGGAAGRGVYEAKRIRSHYLPLLAGRLAGLCTALRSSA